MSNELIVVKPVPMNAEAAPEGLADDVTPTERFYVRSHFPPPTGPESDFHLEVGGAVEQSLALSLADLKSLGWRQMTVTMECAGNNRLSLSPLPPGEPWSAGAVGTAAWTGVPLASVLAKAGVLPEAMEILASGADAGTPEGTTQRISYQRALTLDLAGHPDTLLAFEMNGQPLTLEHGAPLRLIVPRWYGMGSVKWLRRLEAITEPFRGYYQASRYVYDHADGSPIEPVTTMRVKSLITSPAEDGATVQLPMVVRGKAWSGEAPITRVEVAVDGGDSWQPARLLDPVGEHGWRAWEWTWTSAEACRHTLRSRATDAAGNSQPDLPRWNRWGYGSNAVRPMIVSSR